MCKVPPNNRLWTVYIHLFPNGKRYVGITSQSPPENRWCGGSGYSRQPLVGKAIKKYGWENIQHIIVIQTENKEEAFYAEKWLIATYHTNDVEYGYNLTSGGEGTLGRTMSEDSRRKLGENQKKAWIRRGGLSKEQIDKMHTALFEIHRVPVVCYETHEEFPSIKEAAECYHVKPDRISIAVKHFPNWRVCGLRWFRKDQDISKISIVEPHNREKPVICVETGIVCGSIAEAARQTNISASDISCVCKGSRKTTHGLHWGYASESTE